MPAPPQAPPPNSPAHTRTDPSAAPPPPPAQPRPAQRAIRHGARSTGSAHSATRRRGRTQGSLRQLAIRALVQRLRPQKRLHLARKLRIRGDHAIHSIHLLHLKLRSLFQRKLIQKLLGKKDTVSVADLRSE